MSDHKIVGGCSTLLAKSNKKVHFSRPRSCLYQKKMLYLCSDFKSSLSSGPPSGERKNTLLQLWTKTRILVFRHAPSLNKFRVGSPPLRSVDYWEFSLRIYGRILRGICATAGVFSSSLTALGLNVPIGRFYASINAPYAHLIHKISFYWTKKHPNACICAIFVVILQPQKCVNAFEQHT